MFTVCQGTCFCAGGTEGFSKAKQKVLYCFGEVRIFPNIKVIKSSSNISFKYASLIGSLLV